MTVAAIPVSTEVTCDDCGAEFKPTGHAVCRKCHRKAIASAEEDAVDVAAKNHRPAGKAIRDWAARRFLMGQISRAARDELFLCAEDIEVGHG